MVIQLSQTGPEHMLTTEKWVVGKDQSRNINIELEVPLKFCSTRNIQTCTGGHKGLGGRNKDLPCANNTSNISWKCKSLLNIYTSFNKFRVMEVRVWPFCTQAVAHGPLSPPCERAEVSWMIVLWGWAELWSCHHLQTTSFPLNGIWHIYTLFKAVVVRLLSAVWHYLLCF